MRKFRRSSKDSRRRVVVLGGVLLLTLIWAQSEMRPGAGGSKSGGAASARGTASAATTPGAASHAVDQATPEGWGADPFDPRPLVSNPVPTRR